jgi:hypothetical protein
MNSWPRAVTPAEFGTIEDTADARINQGYFNTTDRIKRDDSAGWRNYAVGNYSPSGRTGWAELDYRFGG